MPICVSCRRRFIPHPHTFDRQWRRTAFYLFPCHEQTPSDREPGHIDNSANIDRFDGKDGLRQSRSIPSQQLLGSVENDFVDRLLAGREAGSIEGPYSKPRRPRERSSTPKLPTGLDKEHRSGGTSSPGAQLSVKAEEKQLYNISATQSLDPIKGSGSSKSPPRRSFAIRYKSYPQNIRNGVKDHGSANPSSVGDLLQSGRSGSRQSSLHTAPRLGVPPDNAADGSAPSTVIVAVPNNDRMDRNRSTLETANVPGDTHQVVSGNSDMYNGPKTPSTDTASSINKLGKALPVLKSLLPDTNDLSSTSISSGKSIVNPHTVSEALKLSSLKVKRDIPRLNAQADVKASSGGHAIIPNHRAHRPVIAGNDRIQVLENAILDPRCTIADSWERFLILQTLTMQQKIRVSKKLRVALVEKFTMSWLEDQNTTVILTPSAVLRRVFVDTDLDLKLWARTLWLVLMKAANCLRTNASDVSETSNHAVLHEIKLLWDVCLQSTRQQLRKASSNIEQARTPLDWGVLVHSEQMKQIRLWFTKAFQARLQVFFPMVTGSVIKDFDSAALISFAILQARSTSPKLDKHSETNSTPFQQFIAHLLPYSDIRSQIEHHTNAMLSHNAAAANVSFVRGLLERIATQEVTLHVSFSDSPPDLITQNSAVPDKPLRRNQLEEFFEKRVARTIESQNIVRLESIWREACTTYEPVQRSNQETGIPTSLFGFFLTAFMALRRPNRAVDVWNVMINSGIQPSVAHWDAMLKGCGIAKDENALHDLWGKMLASGVKPDAQVWATRIHAATISGKWRHGIEAFRDMTRIWMEEVKRGRADLAPNDYAALGDVNGVPKPNTQTLNGLVVGLSRGSRQEELVSILKLARSLGIKSDSYTFNPLIRNAIHSGNNPLALKLLQQMQQLGIQPDVATFTMMLQSLFRGTMEIEPSESTMQPSAREQAAAEILQIMHRHGLQSNAWTFATLINGLLKSPGADNITAAYAVINYMTEKKIPLSTQIVTTLLTYHFNQQPANLAAIEALWNRARMEPGVFLDVYFYDRLIEGFAMCGETGRMMAALTQAGKRGKIPGWPAMTEVVSALVRAGDHPRAEEIVAAVRQEELDQDKLRHNKGRENFWQRVQDLGLEDVLQTDDGHTFSKITVTGSDSLSDQSDLGSTRNDVASSKSPVQAAM